jgi:hypothetical protein
MGFGQKKHGEFVPASLWFDDAIMEVENKQALIDNNNRRTTLHTQAAHQTAFALKHTITSQPRR